MNRQEWIAGLMEGAKKFVERDGCVAAVAFPFCDGKPKYIQPLDLYDDRNKMSTFLALGSLCRLVDAEALVIILDVKTTELTAEEAETVKATGVMPKDKKKVDAICVNVIDFKPITVNFSMQKYEFNDGVAVFGELNTAAPDVVDGTILDLIRHGYDNGDDLVTFLQQKGR